jgi:hypothetical protein
MRYFIYLLVGPDQNLLRTEARCLKRNKKRNPPEEGELTFLPQDRQERKTVKLEWGAHHNARRILVVVFIPENQLRPRPPSFDISLACVKNIVLRHLLILSMQLDLSRSRSRSRSRPIRNNAVSNFSS